MNAHCMYHTKDGQIVSYIIKARSPRFYPPFVTYSPLDSPAEWHSADLQWDDSSHQFTVLLNKPSTITVTDGVDFKSFVTFTCYADRVEKNFEQGVSLILQEVVLA